MDRLRLIMARLRSPDGCPWDREQTLETLASFLLEECYETLDAMASGDPRALEEELGDLLFQIVFQSRVAEERGDFDLESVMRGIGDKIIRRHPHVFAEGRLETADQVLRQWEEIKGEERRRKGRGSMFDSVPKTLPALLKALRVSAKAARVGFDWPDTEALWAKVREEMGELEAARRSGDREAIAEELGDLLFTLANVARREDLDPERVLQQANDKFLERFAWVERRLGEEGLTPSEANRDRMERLWEEAKRALRKTSPGRTSPSGGTSGNAPRRAPRSAG
jgi:MazG family protein